jgi:dTDP-4-amino-4,6-dideoxygalactose transaminase
MSSNIPLLDLNAQNDPLLPELRAAFDRVATSCHFILGPEVDAFEKECAKYIGSKHAVGVSSGTDALLLCMMALGIGPGDEVITSPFSFFATAGCIARVGATPVFVDIDPVTYNLDPKLVDRAVTTKTKAIMPVHLFGQSANMGALCELPSTRRIPMVEDAAQAIGAVSRVGNVGTIGTFGCFSFFPSKNLGAFGDAGLVTTNDDALAEKLRVMRAHGSKPKYFHAMIGGNFRIDALQAAILRVKLPHLDSWTKAREKNAALYNELFAKAGLPSEKLGLPKKVETRHVYNQYVIRTKRRDDLRKHLTAAGIGTEIYYPKCLHLQECFASLGYKDGSLPHAEAAAQEVLALPIFAELGEARIKRVVDEVTAFLKAS